MITANYEGLLFTSDWREPMVMGQENVNADIKVRCLAASDSYSSINHRELIVLDAHTNNKYKLNGWILDFINIPIHWHGTGNSTIKFIDPQGESVFLNLETINKEVTFRPSGADFAITVGYRVYETLIVMEEISKYSCKEVLLNYDKYNKALREFK